MWASSREGNQPYRLTGFALWHVMAGLHMPAVFWVFSAASFTILSVRDASFLQGLARVSDARIPIRDLLEASGVLVAAGFRTIPHPRLSWHCPGAAS